MNNFNKILKIKNILDNTIIEYETNKSYEIKIENQKINNSVIEDQYIYSITFKNCDIYNLSIKNSDIKILKFENCKIINFNIYDLINDEYKIIFKNSNIQYSVLDNIKTNSIYIELCYLFNVEIKNSILNNLNILYNKINTIKMLNNKISKQFNIKYNNFFKSNFINCILKEGYIKNNIFDIYINSCVFNNCDLLNNETNKLTIKHTDFNDCKIDKMNLRDIEKCEFNNCDLLNIVGDGKILQTLNLEYYFLFNKDFIIIENKKIFYKDFYNLDFNQSIELINRSFAKWLSKNKEIIIKLYEMYKQI